MMKTLKINDEIFTSAGLKLVVTGKLGDGGQGIVYKVKSEDGKEYALKWYKTFILSNQKAFYSNLESNINNGSPGEIFLWPLDLVGESDGYFGYIMDIIPKGYYALSQFLLQRVRFANMETQINAALNIVNGFRILHNNGYSYQDLNDGNFFINPDTGDVLICDNDNVSPNGKNTGIKGKFRYMAPEVLLNEKEPDIHSDRFSLAIILYLLLFFNHPLECVYENSNPHEPLSQEENHSIYGENPIFVWDPENTANNSNRKMQSNQGVLWNLYPKILKDMFLEAFSHSLMRGEKTERRITEKRWEDVLINTRSALCYCKCGIETFYQEGGKNIKCSHCKTTFHVPPILKLGRYKIPLLKDKHVYLCQTRESVSNFGEVVAVVVANKKEPSILGIKVTGENDLIAILPNGKKKLFKNGEVIKVAKGIKIEMNNQVGEII